MNKISKSQERRIKIMKDAIYCEHPLLADAIKKRWAVKIRVTPEQSKIVQQICFDNDVFWRDGSKSFTGFTDPFLYTGFYISSHNDSRLFNENVIAREYDFENKRFVEEERRLTMQKIDEFEKFIRDVDKPKLTFDIDFLEESNGNLQVFCARIWSSENADEFSKHQEDLKNWIKEEVLKFLEAHDG